MAESEREVLVVEDKNKVIENWGFHLRVEGSMCMKIVAFAVVLVVANGTFYVNFEIDF